MNRGRACRNPTALIEESCPYQRRPRLRKLPEITIEIEATNSQEVSSRSRRGRECNGRDECRCRRGPERWNGEQGIAKLPQVDERRSPESL